MLSNLADGVDVRAEGEAVEQASAGHGDPDVLDRDEYADAAAGNLDQLLAAVYGLLASAILPR